MYRWLGTPAVIRIGRFLAPPDLRSRDCSLLADLDPGGWLLLCLRPRFLVLWGCREPGERLLLRRLCRGMIKLQIQNQVTMCAGLDIRVDFTRVRADNFNEIHCM